MGEGVARTPYRRNRQCKYANLAKVFITGNYSATRGGSIGTNGNVTIGKLIRRLSSSQRYGMMIMA